MSQSKKSKPINRMSTGDLWPTKTAAPPASQGTNREMFVKLDADLFLAHQLFRHGLRATVLEGVTVPDQRRERIRTEILRARLADAPLKVHRGEREETFAEAFSRLYHQPLHPIPHEEIPQ